MATYDEERLIARSRGERGKLPAARIRRSIATTYYAIFHFLLEESGRALIGSHNNRRRRRRAIARAFSHAGMRLSVEKIRGAYVDPSIEDFLRPSGSSRGALSRRHLQERSPPRSPTLKQNDMMRITI